MSNPINKLAKFTGRLCSSVCSRNVPDCERARHKQVRCCDRMFCDITEGDFPKGVTYERTGHEVPFMGKNGCVVKPEHRPFCTAFLCSGVSETHPDSWRKYLELCERAGVPANKTNIFFKQFGD